MTHLLRGPGWHRCSGCGWEGKAPKAKRVRGKDEALCPACGGADITPIPPRELPGHCFCCGQSNFRLTYIDHIMVRECRVCGAGLNLHTLEAWIWEVKEMEQAVSKLKAEMDKSKNNPYVQLVGNYLLQLLESNPAAAEHVAAEKKMIAGSLDAMKSAAKKKAVGGMAMLTDEEGYSEVRKYFGIEGTVSAPAAPTVQASAPANAEPPSAPVSTAATPPPAKRFDVSLDDLLGDL